jgi:large subunit ribosomal protein L21
MYAIIAEGGRQYKVTGGDVIRIDRPEESLGGAKTVTFDQVLLVGGEGQPRIGTPLVPSATVTGEVLRAMKGPKIDIIKYKRRKGFHKHLGHRQNHLEVRITAINV